MKNKLGYHGREFTLFFLTLFVTLWIAAPAFSYPIQFVDSKGDNITIQRMPSRVVSLVPGITEIIFGIGAGNMVKAVTYHDICPSKVSSIKIVGGFFSPSITAIEKIRPDLIFVSSLHKKIIGKFTNGGPRLVNLNAKSVSDIYRNISLLGMIFDREREAARLIDEIKEELRIIAAKVVRIPVAKRKRVIRLMGRNPVMTPGDNSFQNEYIRLAGGIPPRFNKMGNIVTVTKGEWMRFNPQVIYGCGGDRKTAKEFLDRPGWRDVDAVRNGKIFYFPCDLTCRASTHAGYFVSWLSARIYADEFSKNEEQVLEEKIYKSRKINLDLNYIKDARISYSHIYDFTNKTLIIDFKRPLSLVSTLEGPRKGIESVGNHYLPPPCWGLGHKMGLKRLREHIYHVIGKSDDTAGFLFTGADMDNLSIGHEKFKKLEVYALVTAGVKSNAVRMSVDEGGFYEPGTINIILLPNVRLTQRAMSRAIISATEAKTAALQDLDIRSSYSPRLGQATGTGTDNIIVAGGDGMEIDNAGGHSKLGELIAKAVYKCVKEAVYKQNGVVSNRNVFQRLKDRKIIVFGLIASMQSVDTKGRTKLVSSLEELLLQPRYASFVEASFSLSDDYEKGLVSDLTSYKLWCDKVAEEIAGMKLVKQREIIKNENLPPVLRMALNAMVNGIYQSKIAGK